ncbi:ribokinase [Pseudarthrobacter sp. B4EP4b]|uniref:ribokinase n=1 Tax=Pseudarthrobacter sp. B4EP4b TaxID=2590664 RepID=UPI0011520903|nr:ribokinase [Pseudarthrobacter sp. B4EP4b]
MAPVTSLPTDIYLARALEHIHGRVTVVGSANADLTVHTETLPRPGQTVLGTPVRVLPGGKSANQAVQAALLGASVKFVGAVGEDHHGELLRASMHRAGVVLTDCVQSSSETGTAVVVVDNSAENTIVISPGANNDVTDALVNDHADAVRQAKVLGLCLETPITGALAAARLAAASGTLVLLNLSPYRSVPAELLRLTDVLIVNENELADLLPPHVASGLNDFDSDDQGRIAAGLSQLGVEQAVITLGPRGSLVIEGASTTVVPAIPTDAIDTTGCGDAFFGTVLAALASGTPLLDACRLASCVASIAATGHGAQASYADRARTAACLTSLASLQIR